MEQILKVGAAISALRARANDRTIGSRVEAGKYQMVSTAYAPKGKSTVVELSGWMAFDAFIAFINAQ